MNQKEAKIRIEKLQSEIRRLNYEYFVLDRSLVSEAVRDSLKKELVDLETHFPELITPDSPTQRVGSILSGRFPKISHLTAKKSLQDGFNEDDIRSWHDRIRKYLPAEKIEFFTELKIDGLNITVHYEKGRFARALSRGDGITGEDVTHTVKTIESIPLRLNQDIDLEVSGEVFISKETFEKINREQKTQNRELFANPRNAAAGSIRQLDPKVAKSRTLDAFFYSIGKNTISKQLHSQEEVIATLKNLGLKTNPYIKLYHSIDEVVKYCKSWHQKRQKLQYEIDGIVIKVNNLDQREKLGFTAKFPRSMLAYKFPAAQSTSRILDVKVQVGRTGALTPVAVLEPTLVAGSTISRATLHNEDEIRRKDIRIGDTVIIQKAGDVIPEVVEVLKNLRNGHEKVFEMPTKCPICGHRVIKADSEAISRCSNPNCYARDREQIIHFVSKKALNIDGLGEKVVLQLIDQGLIQDNADIFSLTEGDFLSLPLFKKKRARNVLNAIEKSKKVPFHRFLFSLGIRHLGEEGSAALVEFFIHTSSSHEFQKTDENQPLFPVSDLIKITQNLSPEKYLEIEGFGEKIAQSVHDWFHESTNISLLKKLEKKSIKPFFEKKTSLSRLLDGKNFVVTGTLRHFSREQAKEAIRFRGGKILSVVSSQTDFLVAGEKPGSKMKKAGELGVKVINEAEFLKMISEEFRS